jgi:hypothetical protein
MEKSANDAIATESDDCSVADAKAAQSSTTGTIFAILWGRRDYNEFALTFNSGFNPKVLFYVGLWGDGTDQWIQIDDFVIQWQIDV